ncbi:exo-alpha-sialidase [Flavobacteriaceae bacterium F89]|uniref:exo-alpha-sialidase n=1 Tax=Cerina litoralis TaxID=2874477 RepID=A0AAE3JT38_9FLAO|nr:exo-alpha-sialidase [Cerina litoralis]MCG2461147.1 exo-alpha-sialidase [Cerina litoralis]
MKNREKLFLLLWCTAILAACQRKVENDQIFVTTRQPVLPVLAKKEKNKVLKIKVDVKDSTIAQKVTSFNFSLEGTTNISDIEMASLLYAKTGNFDEAEVLGSQKDIKSDFKMDAAHLLSTGENYFWLAISLNGTPELSHKIGARLVSVELEDRNVVASIVDQTGSPQRIGIALRQHNDDGVNTFRIPGLATTNNGTLIGVYDVRWDDPVDLQENIDVGLSRSTDGGQTWEPMKIIMDMGDYGGFPEDQNGIGDPAVLIDRNTNTIWVAALWLHGYPGKRAWNASEPGLSPEKTGQFMLVKSEDDGVTWSDPINITKQIKKPEWQLFFDGPGMGITVTDGTLVFAAQFKDKDRVPHSTIIYSKDGGKKWKVGTGAKSETTEAQVVELPDGSLMLNMRDDRNRAERKDSLNGRSVAITKDLGKTWTEHPTSRKALQESNCMASIIGYNRPDRGQLLFFSNPDTKVNRDHMTIKTSFDEGMTWPKENQLELYEDDTYGYSCLTMVDDDHIGILYEGTKELYFEKIALEELLKKTD